MVSVIDCDSTEEDLLQEPEVQADIMTVEFVQGNPYTFPTLMPLKAKKRLNLIRRLICLIFLRQIRYLIVL